MTLLNRFFLWALTTSIITMVSLNSLFGRQRMSHENGLVARGKIRIVDDLKIPPSQFFKPGQEFPCRVRHASVSFADDARLVVRSGSLKFDDSDHASPLDIMMNTGTEGPFANAGDFLRFMITTIRGREQHLQPYLHDKPAIAKGIQNSICYPDTFALLNYHSKTALGYRDATGKNWYIKFKMAPFDRGPDRGRPTEDELDEYWLQEVKPGEVRSRNFLKDEFRKRLEEGPVKYHLQAQFHEVRKDEDRNVLNCAVAWDEETCPWLDVAEVEVDEIIPTEEGNLTWFDICNHPSCMSIPQAQSIFDPASINYLRTKDIWARRARMLGYKWRGQLPPLVDDRCAGHNQLEKICLPEDESSSNKEMRNAELVSQRDVYAYAKFDGTPPYVRHLPESEKFTAAKSRSMIKDLAFSMVNDTVAGMERLFKREKNLDAFLRNYKLWQEPAVSKRFGSDLEFGRQRLRGVNPVLIKRCETIPDNFPVTDELVEGLLPEGATLESARKDGRLFLLDHAAIGGIRPRNGYLAVPITLFHVNEQGQLLPLAIQLQQTPGPDVPIFTPKDDYWLWTTVKAYVQSADATVHEVSSHLLRTHLVMETFAVAMHRRLHRRHPVHQLLAPHFHATMAINHSARTVMLKKGGPIDKTLAPGAEGSLELIKQEYEGWDFSICHLEKDLTTRGVDNESVLTSYHYRDDGLRMWQAIDSYVKQIVNYWYDNDAMIKNDEELQAWFDELQDPEQGRVKGLPYEGQIHTRSALQEVLTSIIFTVTAEHSSVNNGQYAMFGYPPNVPGSMYRPVPSSKTQTMTEADFVACLPNQRKCNAQMQMVHLLSQPTRWKLGDFEKPYFHGIPEIWEIVRDFRLELDEISADIKRRNRGLAFPYPYMDPEQISESIAI